MEIFLYGRMMNMLPHEMEHVHEIIAVEKNVGKKTIILESKIKLS